MHTGGRMLAMHLSGTYFMHPNLHGSTTIDTNASGGSIEDLLFYPWGDLWASTSLSEHHFSGFQYRDDAHGLDPTLFRMYKYGLGRWMTPDPLGGDVTGGGPSGGGAATARACAGTQPSATIAIAKNA